MRKIVSVAWLVGALLLAGCATAPYTGRKQMLMYSQQEENKLGSDAWAEILKTEKQSGNKERNAQVKRVADKLLAVSGSELDWEFAVLESNEANAFALPGGKIAVYTGLFDYADGDDELAVVLSHEIAHVLARHSNEGMSQQAMGNLGASLGMAAVNRMTESAAASRAASILIAGGLQYGVLLPYSRTHESEADEIGIVLMYKAGFDIGRAVPFWRKFSQAGADIPAFLSTHPSGDDRIRAIGEEVEALRRGAYRGDINGG